MPLCDIDEVYIDRQGSTIAIRDEDNRILQRLPLSWTDEQVQIALKFANTAYDEGVEYGKMLQRIQIKTVLGLN